MSRPRLPSISQSAPQLPRVSTSTSSEIRSLPPLSALLNGPSTEQPVKQEQKESTATSPAPQSEPVSPIRHGSTDLFSHKISTPAVTTPVRLPSFDSIKFENNNKNETPAPPTLQHSKSFSVVSSNTHIPTPTSQQPLLQTMPSIQQNLVSPLVEKRSYAFISHSPSTFPLQEPSIDNAQLARRKRRRTSPLELSILQAEFEKGQTPNRTRRMEIAKKVHMTEKAIQIWFQNRRQTLRRQSNAEKEIHHIGPIYHHIPAPQQTNVAATASTPIRQPNMIYTTPNVPQQFYPGHSASSPIKVDTNALPSNPPSSVSQSSSPASSAHHSSPIHQQVQPFPAPVAPISAVSIQPPQPSQPNFLVTPARTPKTNTNGGSSNAKSPIGGSTLTFRLKNKSTVQTSTTPSIPTTTDSNITSTSSDPTSSDPTTSMTPVSHTSRTRQKPLMRVNPTPQKSSSPIQKENLSPGSSPFKKQGPSTSPVRGGERIVLGELSFNKKGKPKNSDEDQCVANLLNLRNWQ